MHVRVGFDDVLTEPGSVLVIPVVDLAAAPDDAVKVMVEGHLVLMLVDQRAHRVWHVNLVGEDHEPLHGAIPGGTRPVTEREPGEDAVTIGQQQPLFAQVATDGKQSVLLALSGVRKRDFVGKFKNHNLTPLSYSTCSSSMTHSPPCLSEPKRISRTSLDFR